MGFNMEMRKKVEEGEMSLLQVIFDPIGASKEKGYRLIMDFERDLFENLKKRGYWVFSSGSAFDGFPSNIVIGYYSHYSDRYVFSDFVKIAKELGAGDNFYEPQIPFFPK